MIAPGLLIPALVAALALLPGPMAAAAADTQMPPHAREEPALQDQSAQGQAAQAGAELVVIDWTMLETLIALGHPPIGAADLSGYATWVTEPALPAGLVDIGLRNQPNLELLSQLAPDRFLVAPLFARLEPLLAAIAPVQIIALYSGEGALWPRLREFTRRIAAYTPEPEGADLLITQIEAQLHGIAQALPEDRPGLLLVQFMDDRHVRVFGQHSLYSAVLERLGIVSAWQGKTNAWGFSLVGLEALADAGNLAPGPIRMVVIEPLPPGLPASLARPGLWQSLPSVARGDVMYLPAAWSFGGLPSAQRFAELLQQALLP